jgi:hypothetical protein
MDEYGPSHEVTDVMPVRENHLRGCIFRYGAVGDSGRTDTCNCPGRSTPVEDIEAHGAEYWWHQAGFWKRSFMELSKLINAKEKTEAKTQCSPLKGMHEMRKKKSSGG